VAVARATGEVAVLYEGEIHEALWRVEGSRLVLDLQGDVSIRRIGLFSDHPETMARLILLNHLRRARRPDAPW
jgi:hypothetical protein